MQESQPTSVDAQTYDGKPSCSALMVTAEKEFVAFTRAITELFGPEEATLSAEDWLNEVASRICLPGPTGREWRNVTAAALARLAIRMASASD
jgi:hypothetical protein